MINKKVLKTTSGTSKARKAFSLAEVLIALAIVGVVASITIPNIVNKYQEIATVQKVKKFYSTMSQSILLSINQNGFPDEWAVSDGITSDSAKQLANYIKPYLKISKDCGVNSGCLKYKTVVKTLKGETWANYDTDSRYYKIILHDGSYIWFRAVGGTYCKSVDGGHEDNCGGIFFDINGPKVPNTVGKDIFTVYLTPSGLKNYNNGDNCNLQGAGWSCLNYILTNGNMKYLHK